MSSKYHKLVEVIHSRLQKLCASMFESAFPHKGKTKGDPLIGAPRSIDMKWKRRR